MNSDRNLERLAEFYARQHDQQLLGEEELLLAGDILPTIPLQKEVLLERLIRKAETQRTLREAQEEQVARFAKYGRY